ncbi:MAG: hypothetical protein WEA59_05025 [Ferruginibacter sp.]
MKKLLCCLFMLSCSLLLTAQTVVKKPASGSVGSWRLLGTVTAALTADHDKIIVAGPYDYFRKLKFKVTNASINMQRMIVTYHDGAPENIELRFNIPQGGESRVIDLKGGKRKLRTVEFWYDTKGVLNGKANVTLFGIK